MSDHLTINADWIQSLEDANYGVWDWDLITQRVSYSKGWKAMLGYAEEEIGETLAEFQDLVHPDDLAALWTNINQHLAGLTPVFVQEFRMRAKDQSYRWIVSQGTVVTSTTSGQPARLVATHKDITESKQAFAKLNIAFAFTMVP